MRRIACLILNDLTPESRRCFRAIVIERETTVGYATQTNASLEVIEVSLRDAFRAIHRALVEHASAPERPRNDA